MMLMFFYSILNFYKFFFFFFSSRRRHTRSLCDWSSDVCSSDLSGVIQNVTASGACAHATGTDGEDTGITVQLFPYNDTPNNGGVYKVWVSPTTLLDCSAPA